MGSFDLAHQLSEATTSPRMINYPQKGHGEGHMISTHAKLAIEHHIRM